MSDKTHLTRRGFLTGVAASGALTATTGAATEAETAPLPGPRLLAPSPAIVYESPRPKRVYPRSPGICVTQSGRIVVTWEYNLGAKGALDNPKFTTDGRWCRGFAEVSDDGGKTFRKVSQHPIWMARPFEAGGKLYVLGHDGDLGIMVSEDDGDSWSEVAWLTQGEKYHQAPCNVRFANGRIYLVMERDTAKSLTVWPIDRLAPIVLSAPVDAGLTKRETWTFSNEVTYRDMAREIRGVSGIGAPLYFLGPTVAGEKGINTRPMAPMGWLETNIVDFPDPDHLWHDPNNRTMVLWLRAHTGMTNYACIAQAVEADDGSITVGPVHAPSGEPMLYVPCPGGHLKFHILYDAKTRLYWLVSNQSTDSMTRPDRLPDSRYALPDNERHRLALHFSKNCIDWCFAGLVDKTDDPRQARSYASMAFAGDDLLILARSGNERAKNAHDGNLLTLHRVKQFRRLVY